ncbi:Peptidase M22 glycoprotease [Verrucomicrobia bacterium]|nr:Peptidase M22 glycoprotease [Verrucomicrobiota bacterium]
MKILALEFSSAQRSVAVASGSAAGALVAEGEVLETGGRAAPALGMVEEALCQAQLEREQIECLAVGLGPGSYTGIRAAIALAQGWQLALGVNRVKVVGVSSAECLAAQAQAEGLTGRVGVVIDAQRQEFHLGVFELSESSRRETEPLRLATLAQARACEAAGALLIGPEVTKWFPAGRVMFPRAATLAQLARARTDFVPAEKLEPIYLRETRFVKAPPPRVLGVSRPPAR